MTGKEERTKTEEMKNADKQGAGTGHHGASGQTCDIGISDRLDTTDTLAAVNSDKSNTFLMMKMSEEDQVQTTTTSNTNNNHKSGSLYLDKTRV